MSRQSNGTVHTHSPGTPPPVSSLRKMRRRGAIDVVDAKVAVDLATAQTYSENVFLFIPNLIGTPFQLPRFLPPSPASTRVDSCRFRHRLHAYHTSRPLSPLYELPPKILYSAVWHIVLTRRGRRTGRTRTWADVQVWCGIRYGYRPVRMVSSCYFSPFTWIASCFRPSSPC